MKFVKMQGCGNDFVMTDCFRQPAPENPAALAQRVCDRHFGVGADGLVLMLPAEGADCAMRIYNSDGSEAEMCGNATRLIGKYLYESGIARKTTLTLDTRCGVKRLWLALRGDAVASVRVDMGKPVLEPPRIPMTGAENCLARSLDGQLIGFFGVSMGNPHAVTYDLYPAGERFRALGARMETDEAFPRRTNVEFCRARDRGHADVLVWERGCGPTLACGTGACAALVAGASMGILNREAEISLPGGVLGMEWGADDHLYMTGPAEEVFRGEINP